MAAANDRSSASLDRASMAAAGAASPPAGLVETAAAGDLLGRTLQSVRLTGALFFLVDASSPWCVDVPPAGSYADIILPGASHVMSYHVIVEGHGWASVPGIAPVPFGPGDVILFPQGDAYVMESAPGTPPIQPPHHPSTLPCAK